MQSDTKPSYETKRKTQIHDMFRESSHLEREMTQFFSDKDMTIEKKSAGVNIVRD